MSDPGAFRRALADAALKVNNVGGPEITLLAEGSFLTGGWGLHFERVVNGPDIKHALLMYVDWDGKLYTDLEGPITPTPGATNYADADIDRYAGWLEERVAALNGRVASGETSDAPR